MRSGGRVSGCAARRERAAAAREAAGDAYEKDNEEESERSLPEQKGAADLIKESEQLHEPGDQARSGRSGEVIRKASS